MNGEPYIINGLCIVCRSNTLTITRTQNGREERCSTCNFYGYFDDRGALDIGIVGAVTLETDGG